MSLRAAQFDWFYLKFLKPFFTWTYIYERQLNTYVHISTIDTEINKYLTTTKHSQISMKYKYAYYELDLDNDDYDYELLILLYSLIYL